MSANLRIVESPALPAIVPVDAGGIASLLPKLQAIAEQSNNADELRTAGALAKGMKETAKALGIAELHAELSWIEDTAQRRRAGMESQQGQRTDLLQNATSSPSSTERSNLSRARERHSKLSDAEFEKLKADSLAENIPATPRLIAEAAGKPHVSHNSGENEWYTPAPIIAAARAVMGGIDLDPASSAQANETVQATTFYSIEDDGLNKEWQGRVWMNPPYSGSLIGRVVDKILSEPIEEACVLVNNATETKWAQALLGASTAFCFFASRVRYLAPDGIKNTPLQGQMLCGLHVDAARFKEIFGEHGLVGMKA